MNIIPPDEWYDNEYDLIIDARSPSEFSHSHIINSTNFYTLSDAEHEEVGSVYKHNKLNARIIGARYACLNIASFLNDIQDKVKPYSKIGIYCARGGQRSESFGMVLSMIGYDVSKLKGGYKEYRNYVLSKLEQDFKSFDLKLLSLCGNTGVGKSRLLKLLDYKVDLEGMAKHYGSVFGVLAGVQPSQKYFDDMLFYELNKFSKNNIKSIFIEAESRKIGKIILGKSMYESMNEAFKILCECSMELRVLRCVEDYKMIDFNTFSRCLLRLKPYLSGEVINTLAKHFEAKNYNDVAYILLNDYYDKVYKKPAKVDFVLNLDDLNKARAVALELWSSLS